MATKTNYYAPDGTVKIGYVIDGKTYEDELGTKRIAVGSTVPTDDGYYTLTDSGSVKNPTYSVSSSTQSESSQEQLINELNDAKTKLATEALTSAYNQNLSAAQSAKDAIPETYYDAKNTVAGQSATERQNFNQYAAASGLSSGAGGQAQLSMSNTLQSNLGSLDKQMAEDLTAADLEISQIEAEYKSAIASAIAEGEFTKAQALYDKMLADDERAYTESQYQTSLKLQQDETEYSRALDAAQRSGVYDGMAAYNWSPEQIAGANALWQLQNTAATPTTSTYTGSGTTQTYDTTGLYQAMKDSGNPVLYLTANAGKYGLSSGSLDSILNEYYRWEEAQASEPAIDPDRNYYNAVFNATAQKVANQSIDAAAMYLAGQVTSGAISPEEAKLIAQELSIPID